MARNRVFISYSHNDKDQTFLKEFRVHLKPWEDMEQLNVWSDQRIKPSQDWHQEIQEALETTAVAVLLVSPDFLASEYIRKFELPPLLRAREEGHLDLACLYLRPSVANDEDFTMEVQVRPEATERVKLTKYQFLVYRTRTSTTRSIRKLRLTLKSSSHKEHVQLPAPSPASVMNSRSSSG